MNLNSPAFPIVNQEGDSLEDREVFKGFTKLEYAAILIAQGMCANGIFQADEAVLRAQMILEECNK